MNGGAYSINAWAYSSSLSIGGLYNCCGQKWALPLFPSMGGLFPLLLFIDKLALPLFPIHRQASNSFPLKDFTVFFINGRVPPLPFLLPVNLTITFFVAGEPHHF